MITGRTIIDGTDIKATYGAYIVSGGYDDVPAFPALKNPPMNDWFEHDGVEVDLSSPCLESRSITLAFMMNGEMSKLQEFIAFLNSAKKHTVEMCDISRTLELRMDSVRCAGLAYDLKKVTVVMYDDSPADGSDYAEPDSSRKATGVTVDGTDLSRYDVILNGSPDGLFPDYNVKENLLHESDFYNGETHDLSGLPTFGRSDIRIGCVMRTATAEAFWKRRDSLLHDLSKAGERVIAYRDNTYTAYYKGCRSSYFNYDGSLWWEFDLTFGYIGE